MAQESETLDVTDATGTATFSSACYYIEIFNQGSDTVYVNFGASATTDHFPILNGETLKLYASISDVRAICDTAETATIQIVGTR